MPSATIIGGGPAGLMAAEVLATDGWAVTVHDHMPSVGRKLLLAGRGGLNITHSEPVARLVERYGPAQGRLAAAIDAFGPADLRAWSAGLGEPTVVGTSGRVFPASWRATPLLRAWLVRLAGLGVQIRTRDRWAGPDTVPPDETPADVTILALGGASWPRVGSDGGWVEALRAAGIEVRTFRPANVGLVVRWSAAFVARFAGVPVKNVAVGVGDRWTRGDAVVTTTGLEGGPVYTCSADVRDAIERDGTATVRIDLHPDLPVDEVARRLARRRPKDSMASALRRQLGLAPVGIALLRETDRPLPTDPAGLASVVKSVELHVAATMPIDRAISSAGGVALDEVDECFMLRRLPGTFVAGEMLDWEAPTGGYLLQATFSTAVAAARGAQAWHRRVVATAPDRQDSTTSPHEPDRNDFPAARS